MKQRNQFIKIVKKKIIAIICIVLVLLSQLALYTDVIAYDGQENIKTAINDHSEITIGDEKIKLIENENLRKTEEMDNLSWTRDVSSSIGSINISNNGKTVSMTGNSSLAGKNAIYIIPATPQEQTLQFDYTVEFGDSFNAAGVLLKMQQVGNTLTGYMLSFNNSFGENWYSVSGRKLWCTMDSYIFFRR